MVSAAGEKIPVLVSLVNVIDGAAEVPAEKITAVFAVSVLLSVTVSVLASPIVAFPVTVSVTTLAVVAFRLANVSEPLLRPFTALDRVLKLASSCDKGIAAVALANVLGIVTGSAI
jgi:hypothetical protein